MNIFSSNPSPTKTLSGSALNLYKSNHSDDTDIIPAIMLPNGYQQLDYISSNTATQSYIDTTYKPNNNTYYKVLYQKQAENGAYNPLINNENDIRFGINSPSDGKMAAWFGKAYPDYWTLENSPVILDLYLKHYYELSQKGFLIDSDLKGTPTTYSMSASYNACINHRYIDANGGTSSEYSKGKFFLVEIYENGIRQRNFIPTKRLSDSVIGMYDTENGKFYPSNGAAFTH